MKRRFWAAVMMCLIIPGLYGCGGRDVPPQSGTPKPQQTAMPNGHDRAAVPETFWATSVPMPSDNEIAAANAAATCRSPYIAGWLEVPGEQGFVEYSVDFKADYLPEGTYCCVGQWTMDTSDLERTHTNVHTEYPGVSGYAGFQNTTAKQGKVSILSFWDVFARKPDGTDVTIRAKCIYPETTDGNDSFGGEGTGAHRMVPYDWKAGKWYRMLLQCGTSTDTGNTTVEQWVCDLDTGVWTKLCVYDTGLRNSYFKGNVAVFLENYRTEYAGEIRTMELRNVRIRRVNSGQWEGIEKITMLPNGGLPQYEGSYAFGALSDRVWMITSGVGGDWYGSGRGQKEGTYRFSNLQTGSPY